MISWNKPGTLPKDHPAHPIFVLANVILTTFLSIVSAVATTIADGPIQGELALSDPETIWLTTLYLLGVNTTVPTGSWFADRFGYKTMYAFGVTLFAIASFSAGLAVDFTSIGAARFFEGVGAGFIFPVGLAKITQNFSPKQLPIALIFYIAICFGGGIAIGLFLSGYFCQFSTWRMIFFLIFPLGLLGTTSCWLIHEETDKNFHLKFDYWGFISFALFIATLLIALTYGPLLSTPGGWRSPYIVSLFIIATICLISTIIAEKTSKDPIIALPLFKDPIYTVSCLAMFLLGMSIFASASTTMEYLISGLSYERYVSGKIGIVYGVSLGFFSVATSVLIKKIPVPILIFSGLGILIYSYFLNNQLSWLTGPEQVYPILALRGMGLGLSLGPTTVFAMQHVPKELTNKGATLLTFFRQVGGTYGGTLISIVIIKMKIFHAARFGEQANDQLPAYKITFFKLYNRFYTTASDKGIESAFQAKGAIVKNIETQAFIQAINDAMIVFGYVTAAVGLILAALMLQSWWRRKNEKKTVTL